VPSERPTGLRALRWVVGALWVIHGLWILRNQVHGILIGEALIGVAELASAFMLIRAKMAYVVVATIIALMSGLLSAIFLTKTPIVPGIASAMALVAVIGMVLTAIICIWSMRHRRAKT
jgi:hypothetical protein